MRLRRFAVQARLTGHAFARLNARGPDGLIDAKHPGPRPKLNAEQRAALGRLVEDGPQPAIDGVVRWRLKDLVAWIQEEFAICMDETTLGRTLRAMGYRKLSARPRHHAQDPEAGAAFKKTFLTSSQRSAGSCQRAPRYKSGGRTRPGSGRRTKSPAAGPSVEHGPSHPTTNAPARPISSVPFVRPEGLVPVSSCPPATAPP